MRSIWGLLFLDRLITILVLGYKYDLGLERPHFKPT